MLILNTAAVVIFQVRVSKRTKPLKDSANQYFFTGLLLAGACILYAFAEGPSARIASLIFIVGMGLHVCAELIIAMIHWQISFDLAEEERQGAYYGIWTLGNGLSEIVGPMVVTYALVSLGKPGWMALSAMFIANSLLFRVIVRGPRVHLQN